MSPEPPTERTKADEGFGTGSESDPFTDKMVSGDSEPFIRPITAALRAFAVFYCHSDHVFELTKKKKTLLESYGTFLFSSYQTSMTVPRFTVT